MIIPLRCFSCGRVIAHLWETYSKRVQMGEEPKRVLDELKVKSYCCRTIFMTHIDAYKQIAKYKR